MATDESKAAIAGLVENGIQDVTDAGIASEDASQYTFVGKAERDKIANTAVENSVDAYNNAEKKGFTTENSALAALGLENFDGTKDVSETSNFLERQQQVNQ